MKDIYIQNGIVVENQQGLGPDPKQIVESVIEAADTITLDKTAITPTEFPTWEVIDYLLTPQR